MHSLSSSNLSILLAQILQTHPWILSTVRSKIPKLWKERVLTCKKDWNYHHQNYHCPIWELGRAKRGDWKIFHILTSFTEEIFGHRSQRKAVGILFVSRVRIEECCQCLTSVTTIPSPHNIHNTHSKFSTTAKLPNMTQGHMTFELMRNLMTFHEV